MCFCFTKTLWPGEPRTPSRHPHGGRSAVVMVRPRNTEAGHRSRAIPARGTTALAQSSTPMSGDRGSQATQPRAASMISAT